jgi:hypothetical protein
MSIANRPSIRVFFHPRDVRDVALIQLNRRSDHRLGFNVDDEFGRKTNCADRLGREVGGVQPYR